MCFLAFNINAAGLPPVVRVRRSEGDDHGLGSPQEGQCAKVTRLRCPHLHSQVIRTSGIFSFFGGEERGWRPTIRSCEYGSWMVFIYVSFGAMKHRTCPPTMHTPRISRRRMSDESAVTGPSDVLRIEVSF